MEPSTGLPNGLLDSSGNLINPAVKELQQAGAGLFIASFKEFEVTAKNSNGDPTTIVYRTTPSGATAFTITITYDANYNVSKATVV